MDTLLTILKLSGLVLTGGFAVLGLLTDFRDHDTKQVTRWGRVAVVGIVLSTALSVVSQVLDSLKSVRDAQKATKLAQDQAERTNEILTNLNRSLNPLSNVTVTYWLTTSIDSPEFASYGSRLTQGAAAIVANEPGAASAGLIARSGPHGPEAVGIPSNSPLMPQRDEVIPYFLLRHSGLHFSFFKKHHDDAEFTSADLSNRPQSDLWFQVGTETGDKTSQNYSLEYDLQTHQVTIFASGIVSDPQYWRSNNSIQAVPDLSLTQLELQIDDTMVPTLPVDGVADPASQILSRMRSEMQLDSVILQIGTRELWVKRKRSREMKRLVIGGSRPAAIYLADFPKSVDDLQLR